MVDGLEMGLRWVCLSDRLEVETGVPGVTGWGAESIVDDKGRQRGSNVDG